MAKAKPKRKWWLIGMGIVAIVILYVKFFLPDHPPSSSQYHIEKTGAGSVIDFTESTTKIHTTIDNALQKAGIAAKDSKGMVKEIPRQKVEGIIRWHTRQLVINIPANMSAENIQQLLQTGLSIGQVISSQPDQYQGLSALRLDIGLKDKVGDEEITIISDQVYVIRGKTATQDAQVGGKERGKMAIVIDDFGYTKEPIAAFAAIARPLTFAVLPYRPFTNEAATRGISSGHQVLLHLPMEPLQQSEQSEKITITVAMSDLEIQDVARKAIQSVPGIIGVNNHQGSRTTANKRAMKSVLAEIKANNLFFLDSRTNSQSIGVEMAREVGVRTGTNQLFLDNTDDVSAIKEKISTAQEMAIKHGSVIVIGHARHNTAIAVSEMIPELEKHGIRLVFVSQMMK